MGKSLNSKYLCTKPSWQHKKLASDAFKTTSKKAIQKMAEKTYKSSNRDTKREMHINRKVTTNYNWTQIIININIYRQNRVSKNHKFAKHN